MNGLTLVFVALCVFALAYRYYGLFIANRVLELKEERLTPAVKMADGIDYVKTNKFVLFGHHFAAIAAAGPLLGPVLAAQFGYLPGALWIIIGCVLGGSISTYRLSNCTSRCRIVSGPGVESLSAHVCSCAICAAAVLTVSCTPLKSNG